MPKPPSTRMRASRAKVAALQEMATTSGSAARGERARLRLSAPARGGSNSAASKGASSSGRSGRWKRSRVAATSCVRPRVVAAARSSAAIAAASESAAKTSRRRARRSAKAPAPQKRSATFLASANACSANAASHSFARLGRLQKAAGRQRDERLAEGDARRPALDHDLAVIGDPREIERVRRAGELSRLRAVERPRAAQIDVEPVQGRGHADVERLHQASADRRRARAPPRSRRPCGREQRAGVDRDDVVRARAHEADLVGRAMGKAGVKGRAPPPRAMRVDQRRRPRPRRRARCSASTTSPRFHSR